VLATEDANNNEAFGNVPGDSVITIVVGQPDVDPEITYTADPEAVISYVSGDETFVTIVDGKLHAVAEGQAVVTANANLGGKIVDKLALTVIVQAGTTGGPTFTDPEEGETSDGGTINPVKPYDDVKDLIDDALNAISAIPRVVIGDPTKNGPSAAEIYAVVIDLQNLIKGTLVDHTVTNGTGGNITEGVILYDDALIASKTATLRSLVAAYNGVLILREMKFQYTAPTTAVPNPTAVAELYHDGTYLVELAGASGGHLWSKAGLKTSGGYGGYVSGRLHFDANTNVSIKVGGQGIGSAKLIKNGETFTYEKQTSAYSTQKAGGYNGGGIGGAGNLGEPAGGSGGGATDIRLLSDASNALTGVAASDPRIMVAAGGGGSSQAFIHIESPKTWAILKGGNADEAGQRFSGSNTPAAGPAAGAGTPGVGVTGARGSDYSHSWGHDGNEGRAGGGGGWMGGGAESAARGKTTTASGGGGTNYVPAAALAPVNTVTGNFGDGWAHIKWIE
jgi:hypothetical protein